MIYLKRNVKIVILSALATVKEILSESINSPDFITNNINFVIEEVGYDNFLTRFEKTAQECCKKEIVSVKDECKKQFINQICHIMPDYVFFGPFVPGKYNESELIKYIIDQFPFYQTEYSKKHPLEIWRHTHEVKFVSLFEFESDKIKNDFQGLGTIEISGINCSLTNNIKKIEYFLHEIDKLEEKKLTKV